MCLEEAGIVCMFRFFCPNFDLAGFPLILEAGGGLLVVNVQERYLSKELFDPLEKQFLVSEKGFLFCCSFLKK